MWEVNPEDDDMQTLPSARLQTLPSQQPPLPAPAQELPVPLPRAQPHGAVALDGASSAYARAAGRLGVGGVLDAVAEEAQLPDSACG